MLSSTLLKRLLCIRDNVVASGFKSPSKDTKSSKAISVANATALTKKMAEIFSEIEDPFPVEDYP